MFKPLQLRFRGTTGGIIPINATGGEVFDYEVPGTDQIYRYHVFGNTGSQDFEILNISNSFNTLDVLSVAGAGAGGAADNEQEAGGGGGAGGFRETSIVVSEPLVTTVFVGAGGAGRGGGGNCVPGLPGSKSSFGAFESAGGGGGLPPRSGNPGGIANGGSGGGGTERTGTAGTGNVPATTPRQGNNGTIDFVDGPNFNSFRTYGGGGGGIASPGVNSSGGAGKSASIFNADVKEEYKRFYSKEIGVGTSAVFSRGGDGGRRTFSGGAPGAANSGNGGQGGRAQGEGRGNPAQQMNPGGNGGSGAVIVRYRIQ